METEDIFVFTPKRLRIAVPRKLLEEFAGVVNEENLSEIISEALREELKKVRFRKELERFSK